MSRPFALSKRFPLLLGRGCAGLLVFASASAWAGGFEFPANGTEALGRGGAFTAKADSPLALEYNVAGLANLRGTRLLFDNNLILSSYRFTSTSPVGMGAKPVTDSAGPFYAPWFGLTSDFGYFDRVTFGIGVYGPSSMGHRTYEADGAGRYDIVKTNLLVVFPTLAVGFKLHRMVDLGVSLAGVVGSYQLGTAANAVLPPDCTKPQTRACDTTTDLDIKSAIDPVLSVGVMLHPLRSLDVGLNVRSAPNLGAKDVSAKGTLTAGYTPGSKLPNVPLDVQDTTFTANLPWVIRGGVRYVMRKERREIFDAELDVVYELWSKAQGDGNRIDSLSPLNGQALTILSPHRYLDTYSVRLGGAFNQPVGAALLTARLGAYYDSSASPPEFQRMDFDTLAKVAGTVGAGLRVRGFTLNLAYAFVQSLSRTVTNGQLLPVNGTSADGNWPAGMQPPAVNNGTYEGRNHLVSVGIGLLFEELVRGDRWTRRDR